MTERSGISELRAARRASRSYYWFVGLFSVFVNLLMLTGPLYMLQVYDRVLGSRSVETLVALTGLVAFLYGMMGLLDFARWRVMGRAGARFQTLLDRRVFDATLREAARHPTEIAATDLNDLEAIRRLMTSPVLTAGFDIPFTPIFIAGIWIFHPWLGTLALMGAAILILMAVLNQVITRGVNTEAGMASHQAEIMATQYRSEAETIEALGMRGAAFAAWQTARGTSLDRQVSAADMGGSFSVTTRVFRLFLQSAMLGLGAYLVILGHLTAGAMIASTILLGRALAPIEMVLSQWPLAQRAGQGWRALGGMLARVPPEKTLTKLPRPEAKLVVEHLSVCLPDERMPSLKSVSFAVEPGQALGVIGVTGAGKSTLARAITGLCSPMSGTVRLGGATLDQYGAATRGQHVGYLPQRVQLFDGTVAQNIARMAAVPEDAKVVDAARKADVHEMILGLPDGYNTRVSAVGARLSGGQIQRIGLARAMYGAPVLLVLDEPNSNLDNEGSEAVNSAIKAFKGAGGAALIIAHRPAALRECDLLLMLEDGAVRAFGPRDAVMRDVVRNSAQIAAVKPRAGAA